VPPRLEAFRVRMLREAGTNGWCVRACVLACWLAVKAGEN
jgi:hypothetical protein